MAWPEWSPVPLHGINARLCCCAGVHVLSDGEHACVISKAKLDHYFSLSHWFQDAVDWWLVKLACWESNKCIKSSDYDVYCAESRGTVTLETDDLQ